MLLLQLRLLVHRLGKLKVSSQLQQLHLLVWARVPLQLLLQWLLQWLLRRPRLLGGVLQGGTQHWLCPSPVLLRTLLLLLLQLFRCKLVLHLQRALHN